MIRWSEIESYGVNVPESERRRWMRTMCQNASKHNGVCYGYSGENDDEPCLFCKACDRLGIEVER